METKEKIVPMIPDWLSYLYQPILPLLKKIKIRREGPRGYNPKDILLPQGYVAEVVASGFNTPVHCCFDEEGYCYVVESGHKIDAAPRILKVDPGPAPGNRSLPCQKTNGSRAPQSPAPAGTRVISI